MSVFVSFLDFCFYLNFLFCCVFFMTSELAHVGTLLNLFTHPLCTLYNPDISATRTEKFFQKIKITRKLKSIYRVNQSNLAVFKWIFAQKMAKYTILNNKKKNVSSLLYTPLPHDKQKSVPLLARTQFDVWPDRRAIPVIPRYS